MRRGPISSKAIISAHKRQKKRDAVVAKLAGFWQVASAISLLLIAGLLAWEKFDSTGADRSASRKDTYDPAAFPESPDFPLTVSASPEPIRPEAARPQPTLESESSASAGPALKETSTSDREVANDPVSISSGGQAETSRSTRRAAGISPPSSEPNPPQDLTSAEPEATAESPIDNFTPEAAGNLPQHFLLAQTSVNRQDDSPASTVENQSEDDSAAVFEVTGSGLWLEKAPINDVFQHLARVGGFQYFHNSSLDGEEYLVTGELIGEDSLSQIDELGLMYGLTIHKKGRTVYAFDQMQVSRVPQKISRYQLQYLRPDDIDQTKLILQPFLTPGTGIVEFEAKTNSLILSDSEDKLVQILEFLDQIDRPKDQVAIETRIIRISTSARNSIGVDWSSVLGADGGIGITASSGLNALFGLPELDSATSVVTSATNGNGVDLIQVTRNFSSAGGAGENREGGNLVLSPVQVSAVIRALNTAGIAEQESSPTLITEDNEEGLISVVDRIPIITSTVSETTAGQNSSEEVRYKIDEEDASGDPATTREVGVTLAVTPTILPDGTIRMSLRPRSAQVVEYVESPSGNRYPRVNESSVTTMARIPDGHSLLIGGFYEQIGTEGDSKVPVFGDIPGFRHLFKNSDHQKAHTSLVFIVTPRLYQPSDAEQSDAVASDIYEGHILPDNYPFPDPSHPDRGVPPALKPNLPRATPVSSDNILRPEYSNEFPGPATQTEKIPLLDRLFRRRK